MHSSLGLDSEIKYKKAPKLPNIILGKIYAHWHGDRPLLDKKTDFSSAGQVFLQSN